MRRSGCAGHSSAAQLRLARELLKPCTKAAPEWLSSSRDRPAQPDLRAHHFFFFRCDNFPQPIEKIFNSLPAYPRNEMNFLAPQFLSQLLNPFVIDGQIRLVGG